MSDPQESESPLPDDGLSVKEYASIKALEVFAARDMVTTDGKINVVKVADEIESTITAALVEIERDRAKVGVSPTRLMEKHFSEVPKRSDVNEEDDEAKELADAVYGKVKAEVFRVLNVLPNGEIQRRLTNNGDGLVLCRMKGRKGVEEVAYVTRNRKCIDADNNGPAYHAVELALAKAAALTGMSIDRIPEHGKWFRNRYATSMKTALDSGDATVQAALDNPEVDSSTEDDE